MEKENPPITPRSVRSAEWEERVATMKADKGEFYKVGNFSPGVATHIRHGEYKAFLDPNDSTDPRTYMKMHWEITTRKTHEGSRNNIYIRWLG